MNEIMCKNPALGARPPNECGESITDRAKAVRRRKTSVAGWVVAAGAFLSALWSPGDASGAEPSLRHLANPDRGFRYEKAINAANERVNFDGDKYMYGDDGHIRLSQLYIYLTNYVDANGNAIPIDQQGLNNIQANFDAFRANGSKMVLRFAYDNFEGQAGVKAIAILTHLDQLAPIVQQNYDVVQVMQTGLIGPWGEWGGSGVYPQSELNAIVTKLVEDVVPGGRQTQMRYQSDRNRLEVTKTVKDRIGFHNDFFTNYQHPKKAISDYGPSTMGHPYALNNSYRFIIDGEMPWANVMDKEWCLNFNLNVIGSIKTLRDYHYTSFSVAHNFNLNIANWKMISLDAQAAAANNLPASPDYFKDGQGAPIERSAYDYVRNHLGYNLYVDAADSFVAQYGNAAVVELNLRNYGFSAPHNPRPVYLVILDADNNVVETSRTAVDPNSWQPHAIGDAEFKRLDYSIRGTIGNANLLSQPGYRLGVWMPECQTRSQYDPAYAVRFDNRDGTWVETSSGHGINVLSAMPKTSGGSLRILNGGFEDPLITTTYMRVDGKDSNNDGTPDGADAGFWWGGRLILGGGPFTKVDASWLLAGWQLSTSGKISVYKADRNAGAIDPEQVEGRQWLGLVGSIDHDLMLPLMPGVGYELKVDVGYRKDQTGSVDYYVQLLAGDTVIAEDHALDSLLTANPGDMMTSTLTFITDESNPLLGSNLSIRLTGTSGGTREVVFDNVRFSIVPEPSCIAMVLVAALSLDFWRRVQGR